MTTPTPQTLCPQLATHSSTGQLCLEGVALQTLAAQYGTPLYVYSASAIGQAYQAYVQACAVASAQTRICYAVKANSNIHILRLLAKLGAGFDVVSAGELARVLAAGGKASSAVFAGVGKSVADIEYALQQGVGCFNVESFAEMHRIADVAQRLGKKAPVSVRVNPDVDAKTHPYISTGLKENKFGISMAEAPAVYAFAHQHPWLHVHGIDCHIGSQITEATPYFDALERVLGLVSTLDQQGIAISHLDLGGGLGIRYQDETPPSPADVVPKLLARIAQWAHDGGRSMPSVAFEPGRFMVGNAGVLLTQVEYLKTNEGKHFAIVDAAMNDLMRPAMYQAYHAIVPATPAAVDTPIHNYDIVGPVCESGDWLGKNRNLALEQGQLLAILSAGAYGQSMASNYNSRGRAAEVLVENGQARLIRKRESMDDLLRAELDVGGLG